MTTHKLRKVFLDTSAVIYHQHGHPHMVAAVEEVIGRRVVEVSNFIRMEYLRGVVINLIDLFFLIEREGSVSDALITWSQQVRQERKLKIVLMTISRWLHGLNDADDEGTTTRRLGEFIIQLVRTFDAVYKKRAKDPLRCELGKVKLPKGPFSSDLLLEFYERFHSIKSGIPNCALCEFKVRKQTELTRQEIDLYSAVQRQNLKNNKGYVTQAERLETAARSKDTLPKCSWCERLGDSIIALQLPAKSILVTADRTFEAFEEILDCDVHLLPSLVQMQRRAQTPGARQSPGEEVEGTLT